MKIFSAIKHLIAVLSMAPTVALAIDLPTDGEIQTVWTVTGECTAMPEGYGPGSVWDMSDAVISDVHTRLYRIYGDTLVTRTTEGTRDMFCVHGDTVWHVGVNDRATQHRSTGRGLPYLFPIGADAMQLTDSVDTNIVYGDGGTLVITAQASAVHGGSIVFADGDSVDPVYGYRTDITSGDFTLTRYRWYAEGLMYPVAEYTEYSDTLGTKLSNTIICPPAEQRPSGGPSRAKARMSLLEEEDASDTESPDVPSLPEDAYMVSQDGDRLGIAFNDGWEDASVSLSDTLGRIYHQGIGDSTIDLSAIHERPLLLTLTCRGQTTTVKIAR